MRKVIHWIVCQKAFDTFIMIVILLSRCSSHLVHHHFYHHLHHHQLYTTFVDSFAIAAEDPVDENNPRCKINANGDFEIQQILAKKDVIVFFILWNSPQEFLLGKSRLHFHAHLRCRSLP